ncbi:MAG: DUF3786 domain-containing protein [Deltaproteobacteria bacterium]|nr:DUF3786 domain-containing protein [Deltaproteobacteria bacterium]
MKEGYDAIYTKLIPKLAKCDFQESAARLGLDYANGGVHVSFLKRTYRIALDGVEPLDSQPVNVNNRSVLLYYILSKGQGDPEDSFIPFESIPRMISGLNAQQRLMNTPLERYFRSDYVKFAEAAVRLGGTEEESQGSKHVWQFSVLPKIPLQVVFHEADDEFPVGVQLMLDRTAIQFLEFECLAFMVGCFVHALMKTAQYGDVLGWDYRHGF